MTATIAVLLCSLATSLARHHFAEDGFVLRPSDRQQDGKTELGFDLPQFEDSLDYDSPPLQRRERDGGFHGHQGRRGGRQFGREARQQGRQGGRRQSNRRAQQLSVPEQREGRQTGGLGLALGVLNNPPRGDGAYNFNFSNDDGSARQESGSPSSEAMLVSGSYSYYTPEGELVEMQYTADENGYHATGSHMPTTPPPSPAIRRLLDHLAKVNGGVFY